MPQPESISSTTNGPWPVLDVKERRVLGVLVEKAKTTPDAYPMSINGLTTGCNQKSNRDPILFLSEEDVEITLAQLQKAGLAVKITGGRVERWRHTLYDTWHLGKVDLAILTELLLRGPQTEGEVRTRASRMEPIEDLDHLRRVLRPLVERNLVVYLTAEDRRGAVLTHGFHDAQEREQLRAHHAAEPMPANTLPTYSPPISRGEAPRADATLTQAISDIAELKETVNQLQSVVTKVQEDLQALMASLGVSKS